LVTLAEIFILFMILANLWVFSVTEGRTFTKLSKVPAKECALVLGTSPKTMGGNANPYFISRMNAAMTLYNMGKIKRIIVSGEKSENYDEPAAMRKYLRRNGNIPNEAITEDTEGLNTQMSVFRCKYVYKENDVVIVSQGFHNLRALFVARNLDMNAYAFDAQDVNANESYYRNHFREFLARVKSVVLYVFDITPKVLDYQKKND